jgi:hypothetical protein
MRTVNIHAATIPAVATGRRLPQPARKSSSPKWASPSPTWALWPAREENVSEPSTSAPASSSSSALRNTTSFSLYRDSGRPEGSCIVERLIDTAGHEMGLPRMSRRANSDV